MKKRKGKKRQQLKPKGVQIIPTAQQPTIIKPKIRLWDRFKTPVGIAGSVIVFFITVFAFIGYNPFIQTPESKQSQYLELEPLVTFLNERNVVTLTDLKQITSNGIVYDDYHYTVIITSLTADAYNVDLKLRAAVLTESGRLDSAGSTLFKGGNPKIPKNTMYATHDFSFGLRQGQRIITLYLVLTGTYENSRGRKLIADEYLLYNPQTKLAGKPSPDDIAKLKKLFKIKERL
jgi:hypothetical protein